MAEPMTTKPKAPIDDNANASHVVPTKGALENIPGPPTGADKKKGAREETTGQGRSLGDRRMHERAVGGEGGGQPYDRGAQGPKDPVD